MGLAADPLKIARGSGKRIDTINTDDVLAVLKPIWLKKSETASRVLGRIEKVLDAAKAKGLDATTIRLGSAAILTTFCQGPPSQLAATMLPCPTRKSSPSSRSCAMGKRSRCRDDQHPQRKVKALDEMARFQFAHSGDVWGRFVDDGQTRSITET
ncbi:phage integrase central domain-containing protein [Bradyrhizobium cytisi]|uniref:phage integrase central domain-containing protein n=1 Tax=Bradyrhizobium cytisi TaxID=515489 RepID=UPI001652BEDB